MIVEWDGLAPMARFVRNATSVEQGPNFDKNHFDRGKVDPQGRLVAGTYRTDYCPASSYPNASLYLFEKNRNVQTLISNIKSTTGLAFDTKKNSFYFVDYCDKYISEYDWSPRTGYIGKIVSICMRLTDHNQELVLFVDRKSANCIRPSGTSRPIFSKWIGNGFVWQFIYGIIQRIEHSEIQSKVRLEQKKLII